MAATERVLQSITTLHPSTEAIEPGGPGLAFRVGARTTSASFSDYPEWTMDELYPNRREALITDGACS